MTTSRIRFYLFAIVFTVSFLHFGHSLYAQEAEGNRSMELSLKEALEITKDANFEVRMAESDIAKARSHFQQTNAVFLPKVTLEETGISTDDPLSIFGFKLKQRVVTSADFNPALLNNPDTYQNFTTRLQVQQPVLNTDIYFKRSASRKMLDAAREQFEGTLHYARFQVKDTYYQLLLLKERMNVISLSLESARENERQSQDLFEQEIINKADYLAAGVRRLQLESQQAGIENQLQKVQSNLRFLLDIDESTKIIPTDSLRMSSVSDVGMEAEFSRNSQLDALHYRMSAAREMLKSSKLSFVPSVNIFGSYEFNDEVIFGTRANNYMVGATLRWNLFDGYSKVGKIGESKANLKKAELAYRQKLRKNRMEIENARRSLKQAKIQLEFAESAVEQAAEDYRIRNDRFEQGLEKTTDLLAAEAKLAEARFNRLDALYQHNKSVAVLELLLEQEL